MVIHADDAALSSMIDVVTEMHTRSGLIEEVRASTVDVATAETMVLDYIRKHVKQAQNGTAGRQLDRHRPSDSSPATCPPSTRTCTTG